MTKKFLLETNGYATSQEVLKNTFKLSNFVGFVGASGVGKTFTLKDFASKNDNVYYIEYRSTMSEKKFFLEILRTVDPSNSSGTGDLFAIINQIVYFLNSNGLKKLLIIDEAGEFRPKTYTHLKELRNFTFEYTGIVLSGPESYKNKILAAASKEEQSMAEFYRRINMWVLIPKPDLAEKKKFCEACGLEDKAIIKKLTETCDNFGSLLSSINNVDFLKSQNML